MFVFGKSLSLRLPNTFSYEKNVLFSADGNAIGHYGQLTSPNIFHRKF